MIWAHCDNCIQLLTWNLDMSNWRRHAVMVTTLGTGSFTCTKNKQHELHVSFVWWTWLHIPTILPMRCGPTHTQMIAELCIVALEVCSMPTNFPFLFLSIFSTHWYKYIWYYFYTLWLHFPHLNSKNVLKEHLIRLSKLWKLRPISHINVAMDQLSFPDTWRRHLVPSFNMLVVMTRVIAGWWFQIFVCSSLFGEDSQFD